MAGGGGAAGPSRSHQSRRSELELHLQEPEELIQEQCPQTSRLSQQQMFVRTTQLRPGTVYGC